VRTGRRLASPPSRGGVPFLFVTALSLLAIALWPSYVEHRADAARAASFPTAAPVTKDYLLRDKTIAFWERAVDERHPGDMLSPQHLSEQYLQRYRERGDIDDVLRAQHMALAAWRAQPRFNVPAMVAVASVDLTLHRFKEALALTKAVERFDTNDEQMEVREASLDMELGRYAEARRVLDHLPPPRPYDIARDTVEARYEELTGRLAAARSLFERPTALANSLFDSPAQTRAWFFFRAGEMAFEAGDNDAAIADENTATRIFPGYADALRSQARFECALHRWSDCLAHAIASANVVPYPETLGYEADAQRALGDPADAARTDDLIRTIERIGNAQHISDRLLAIYYSEHRIHTSDAYAIAKRELRVRDDIFTEDTLAWAAAMDGHWDVARRAMAKALRFDTENSLLQYHAGAIAQHFGDLEQAKRHFRKALDLNARFHPVYADDARARLAALGA
jgi:tetratricopeptide (TPR) repeat protein